MLDQPPDQLPILGSSVELDRDPARVLDDFQIGFDADRALGLVHGRSLPRWWRQVRAGPDAGQLDDALGVATAARELKRVSHGVSSS